MSTVQYKCIAEIQVDQAINLQLNYADSISALTLAGAAEEILGKILESLRKTNAYQEKKVRVQDVYVTAFPDKPIPTEKEFGDFINSSRNIIKHFEPSKGISLNMKIRADEMIKRAIKNYYSVYKTKTNLMELFLSNRSTQRQSKLQVN